VDHPDVESRSLPSKIEVLADMEAVVDDLMRQHVAKRELWFPSDLLGDPAEATIDSTLAALRERARGIPDPVRVAIALNLVTEEGLPHFHRLIAVHFGDDTFWRRWNNLWTGEEDRHGVVIHDYCRDSRILHAKSLESMQFEYLRSGFHPSWDYDPYRVFVYTTLQERATQISHFNTGRLAGEHEPQIQYILTQVAADEARHYAFYRQVFNEVLKRDPDQALESASRIMPSIDMPGVSMPHFREIADVIRRAGIYGPRDYLKIVEDQIRFWRIDAITGLKEVGARAQEKIVDIPRRLAKIADYVESRSTSKTFSFDLVFRREFAME
jgi:acyl-[acyl-carrier-protein] desaturase